jgi:hypothetical protein
MFFILFFTAIFYLWPDLAKLSCGRSLLRPHHIFFYVMKKTSAQILSEPLISIFFQSCDVGVLAIIKKRI